MSVVQEPEQPRTLLLRERRHPGLVGRLELLLALAHHAVDLMEEQHP
jgi:hypothetical protein